MLNLDVAFEAIGGYIAKIRIVRQSVGRIPRAHLRHSPRSRPLRCYAETGRKIRSSRLSQTRYATLRVRCEFQAAVGASPGGQIFSCAGLSAIDPIDSRARLYPIVHVALEPSGRVAAADANGGGKLASSDEVVKFRSAHIQSLANSARSEQSFR